LSLLVVAGGRIALAAVSISMVVGFSLGVVLADEGGVPFWFSGQYSSLAAIPATPGWSLPVVGYYYSGDASQSKSFTRGDSVTLGLDSHEPLLLAQPTYAPGKKVGSGQLTAGLGFGYGKNATQADVSVSPSGTEFERSDSVWGFSDLYPVVSLAWNQKVHNWMTYLTGDIPTGSYDSERLSNIGIGHAAIDAGGAYTYLNEKTGHEFSAVVGFTYNWENTDTEYQNGVDSHLDWGTTKFLSAKWQVGAAGYVYDQLSGDSGSGAKLGSFKSRVASIGPQAGYLFTIGGLQAYLNFRGYWEFWAENRVEGYSLFTTLAIPLGPHKTPTKGN
jgi:hypothetical protein